MEFESKDLEDFVRSACESIQKGIAEGFMLSSPVKFELSVVNVKAAEGKIKLIVVGASGNYTKEQVSKLQFEISKVPPQRTFQVSRG